jgi:Skp family chaperone for outer membrane proteins
VAYAKIDDPTITEEVKAQRRAAAEDLRVEIKKLETMITQFERSARTALSEQQRRYRKNIMDEITELVAKRAKSEQYSMVFDVGADSADRSRILLYTDGQYDLTEDILKQLNANAPADILEKMKEEPIESEEP